PAPDPDHRTVPPGPGPGACHPARIRIRPEERPGAVRSPGPGSRRAALGDAHGTACGRAAGGRQREPAVAAAARPAG
ncbi:MAG: hypothetical protein M3275_13565, partial [Thermoproteota archaeon]|nr:hypothetical protein [Thermoproteota archaeon]